tara:strand:- start:3160 stop:3699 length:540 start_codon:yes stop_codon:yes gene_type:complete
MDSPIVSNSTLKVVGKRDLLLEKLIAYYTSEKKERFKNLVSGKTTLSLRIIDWFVTNYSRNFMTSYIIEATGDNFNVYSDYKNQLKAFSKKLFDPFCRRERIEIEGLGTTTIGQMNFFKWAMEKGVIDYALKNVKSVENNMNTKQIIKKNDLGTPKRRVNGKKTAGIVIENSSTVIRFK